MAPHSKKSPKASSSSSKPAKKTVSLMESMLSSAFHKDDSKASSSKPSKRSEGKDSKESTKSESKDHHSSSKHGTKSTKPSSSKPSGLKPAKSTHVPSETFLNSVFFKDESPAPPAPPSPPSQPSQLEIITDPPPQPPQDLPPWKPPTTKQKSVHITEKDKKMAKRQLKIEKLSAKELEEQEIWAKEKLIQSSRCPQNWGWERYTAPAGFEKYSGYRCCGSPPELGTRHVHMISHELLAEGKGGLYILSSETNWWDGPFYPDGKENAFAFQAMPIITQVSQASTLQEPSNNNQVTQNSLAGMQITPQQMQDLFTQLFPGT